MVSKTNIIELHRQTVLRLDHSTRQQVLEV